MCYLAAIPAVLATVQTVQGIEANRAQASAERQRTDLANEEAQQRADAGLAATRTDGELVRNLAYATAICRVRYARVPGALPAAHDIDGLAAYWKAHYNTALGKGTAADWACQLRETLA